MSITTYCVNNLNEAVKRIEIKPKSPFEMNTVVYQNAGVKELLTFDLTNRLGITANLKFSTLQQCINELAVSIGYESEQEPLVWKILSILKKTKFKSIS
jgi:exonuclease V gamma subunit